MKFPSLIRLPRNKKFKFGARHYDPIKEDLEQRISKIQNDKKKDISFNNLKTSDENIFLKPRNLQLILIVFLSTISIGWLFYGNLIFLLFLIIPLVYFLKLHKKL